MNTPNVAFFSGRSESFVQYGNRWRRLTSEDEAHFHTGFDQATREQHLGVFNARRQNGLIQIGFDLGKLNVNLKPAVIERLKGRWEQKASAYSKSLRRSVSRRVHFAKSFARFEVLPDQVEGWKSELAAILENPDSYTPIDVLRAQK